jgi:putative phosphoesterase
MGGRTVIGIVSDTHGYLHPGLADAFSEVDLILHAGDLGGTHILDELALIAPVQAVFGNIDGWEVRSACPEELTTAIDGVTIWMTHIGGRPERWAKGIKAQLITRKPDIFICGHSHILKVERTDDPVQTLYINPGAAGKQGLHKVKTCLRLSIENARPASVDVIHLDEPLSLGAQR